ncbi:hypothetical protein [Aeromicrobium endophyticum]|uniref:Uncharacterized protein n=1 Tax=Aeromicrobium endophyticum TaxID=2292704 RepID=A0A371PAA9_9ACTN|nr:hypothetical protein [Aeromicrobium endophyticum]REK72869.1 hypothetical protein DX116_04530 [Aeromicrobium endophyticum]
MTSSTRSTPSRATSSWFATASQKVRAGDGHPRAGSLVPWGTVHARRLGSARTACGVACFTWPIFFDLDVRHERALEVCDDCRRVALHDRPAVEW